MALVILTKTLADEIGATPDIEGGIGPVLLGMPIEAEDGRVAYCHPWNQITLDWLEAYGGTVVDTLPKDFVVKTDTP